MPFPLDEKYITETENELGVIFPDKFKSKMMQENGGELMTEDDDWNLYPFYLVSRNRKTKKVANKIDELIGN